MRKVKWIFFGYLAVVGLLIGFLAVSLAVTPPRRSDTFYTFYVANLKTLSLCVLGVLCVSVVSAFRRNITTETQRTLRLHREIVSTNGAGSILQ